jgi:hypothetical protein
MEKFAVTESPLTELFQEILQGLETSYGVLCSFQWKFLLRENHVNKITSFMKYVYMDDKKNVALIAT